jgi:2-methylcitrate dehydratase PrpD
MARIDKLSFAVGEGPTLAFARLASAMRFENLPVEIRRLATLCILDTIGVALAAVDDTPPRLVLEEMREQGGAPVAGVIGFADRLPALSAALVNGVLAHAIDYDDVNMTVPGHLSAAIAPALLAQAEERGLPGAEVIAALVAGHETCCRIGVLTSPGHYAAGFHATGTIGAIGAAAASARLLGADAETCAHAMGIAVTQAAGLKSMMGTMAKPMHAGKAAHSGLLAARLAVRGYRSRPDAIECDQGFARTHSVDLHVERALSTPPEEFYLTRNLFKFHAACMATHATSEALLALKRKRDMQPDDVAEVTIHVDRDVEAVCAYPAPRTGLEAKFSLPFAAALILDGRDTSLPDTYGEATVADPRLIALRDRVRVDYQNQGSLTLADVDVRLADGSILTQRYDAGAPPSDLNAQAERLERKFLALAAPVLGKAAAGRLAEAILRLESAPDVRAISKLWRPAAA